MVKDIASYQQQTIYPIGETAISTIVVEYSTQTYTSIADAHMNDTL